MTIRDRARAFVRTVLGEPTTRQAEPTSRWSSFATRPAPARQDLAERWRDSSRAAFLVNTPIGKTILSVYQTSLVADGPSVRSSHPNRAMARALEKAWGRFYKRCDAERITDLPGLLNRVVASLVTSGEAVVHLLTTDRGELRLKVLSPEQISPDVNRPTDGGGQIVAGVEFDASGARVAYWIREVAPDTVLLNPTMLLPVRVPASEVLHIFEPAVPGSVRGRSWLAPVATTILDLHRLLDALGARMNTAALFAGFVSGENAFDDAASRPDNGEISLEPGVVRILPPGSTIEFTDLPTVEGADALVKTMLRAIATGVGLPAFMVDGDYGQINYSSAKAGIESFKRRVAAIRASLLGAQLLQPIWERFVTLEILSGRIFASAEFVRDPEDLFAIAVQWPAFASLEPLKETQANVVAVNNGFKSRAQVVAELGRDVSDVDAEREVDSFTPPAPALALSNSGDQNVAA